MEEGNQGLTCVLGVGVGVGVGVGGLVCVNNGDKWVRQGIIEIIKKNVIIGLIGLTNVD